MDTEPFPNRVIFLAAFDTGPKEKYWPGEFEIAEEESQTPWPDLDPLHFTADRIHWPASWATGA